MAISTETVQRPKIIDAKSPVAEQVRAVSENVKDLYNFVNKLNLSVIDSNRFLENSSNITANRIVEQLRNIDLDKLHDNKMPDKGGVNGDHDRRYYTQRILLNGSQSLTLKRLTATDQVVLPSYTVATLPTGIRGGLINVTDETGGEVPAFFDGTNWRRVTDRAIVS